MQSLQLAFGVEVWQVTRVVIRNQVLDDASVPFARYIAGRKVQQSGVIRAPHKLKDIDGSIRVSNQCIAQIGVEVRQARAVDDEVEVSLQTARSLRTQSEPGLRNIALHDFDPVAQEIGKCVRVAFK